MSKLAEIELVIKTAEAAKSVGEIRKAMKDIKTQMMGVGEDSAEFDKLAASAARLADRVEETQERIADLNPDKFAGLQRVAQGAASGVQLATSAMALFGNENKDVEKTLMKVQAAMSFAQAINNVEDLKKGFDALFKMIIANPIGALVAALGLLAVAASKVYDDLFSTNAQLKRMEKSLEDSAKAADNLVASLDNQARILEAQGGSEQELFEIRKKSIEVQLKQVEATIMVNDAKLREIEANDSLYESYLKASQGIAEYLGQTEYSAILEIQIAKNKAERAKEIQDKQNEQIQLADKLRADLAILQINRDKEVAESGKKMHEDRMKAAQEEDDLLKRLSDEAKAREAKKDEDDYHAWLERKKQREDEADHKRMLMNDEIARRIYLSEQKKKRDDADAAYTRKIEQMRKDFQISTVKSILDITGELFKKNAKVQKGVAAAQTLVDTYLAAQKAYTSQLVPGDPSSPIRGAIAAGLAVAAGLARVKNILAVDESSGGSVSSSEPSSGNFGGSVNVAPNINASSTPSTLLTETGQIMNQNTQQQAPLFVSVQEIRSVSGNVEAIEARSRF